MQCFCLQHGGECLCRGWCMLTWLLPAMRQGQGIWRMHERE